MRAGPQLIAYADRLAGDLAGLGRLLDGPLAGAFDGVHVLPFYDPIDGADAGFDPVDHLAVDRRLGSWADVAALGAERSVMGDVIVNHVSVHAAPMQHWLEHGDASPHASLFLTPEKVFAAMQKRAKGGEARVGPTKVPDVEWPPSRKVRTPWQGGSGKEEEIMEV